MQVFVSDQKPLRTTWPLNSILLHCGDLGNGPVQMFTGIQIKEKYLASETDHADLANQAN